MTSDQVLIPNELPPKNQTALYHPRSWGIQETKKDKVCVMCPGRLRSPHLQLFSIHPNSTIILEKILRGKKEMFREGMRTSSEASEASEAVFTASPKDTGEDL